MKRVWAGIGLLAVAGLGTTVLAAPSGAGEAKPEPTDVVLGATWSPNPAAPGAEVTLTPDEPCSLDVDRDDGKVSEPGVVFVFTDDESGGFEIPMEEDGSWSFSTTAPDEPGDYPFVAECRSSTWQEEMDWCQVVEEEAVPDVKSDDRFQPVSYTKPAVPTWNWFNCEFEFYDATLTVETPTTPETPTPPPPATPIEEPPDDGG